MTYGWLVKFRRYDGSESVHSLYLTHEDARAEAKRLNAEYQASSFYVERYNPRKALS